MGTLIGSLREVLGDDASVPASRAWAIADFWAALRSLPSVSRGQSYSWGLVRAPILLSAYQLRSVRKTPCLPMSQVARRESRLAMEDHTGEPMQPRLCSLKRFRK